MTSVVVCSEGILSFLLTRHKGSPAGNRSRVGAASVQQGRGPTDGPSEGPLRSMAGGELPNHSASPNDGDCGEGTAPPSFRSCSRPAPPSRRPARKSNSSVWTTDASGANSTKHAISSSRLAAKPNASPPPSPRGLPPPSPNAPDASPVPPT